MAYISFQPKDFFNSLLYSPDADTWNAWTGLGFQPNFTWHKSRTSTGWNGLCDSVRGVDASPSCKAVYSNSSSIEETSTSEYLDGYQSDGFTTGQNGSFGGNGENYVAHCWKAGTTSGLTGGTITPSAYSIDTTSGFGIYKYTGGSSTDTIAHGLGAVPKVVLIKSLTTTNDWTMYHAGGVASAAIGNGYLMVLNGTGARSADATTWDSTTPTSTLWYMGDSGDVNNSARDYIAYVWAEKKGYSQFGTYPGNSSTNGPFIYCGFKPALIIIKKYYGTTGGSGGGDNWFLFDNKRIGYNPDNKQLYPNVTTIEGTGDLLDINSNGFKCRSTDGSINEDDNEYLYMAFAEAPIVSSNDVPTVAR